MFKNLLIITAALTITACAIPEQYVPTEAGFSVYYNAPSAVKYTTLGIINYDHYRPGFRQPVVTDAIPELTRRAKEKGGNGVIIRDSKVDRIWNRNIVITAEVIKTE